MPPFHYFRWPVPKVSAFYAIAGADGFNFEYLVDLEAVANRHPEKILIGNLNSATLARGSPEEIEAAVQSCIRAGAPAPGFVLNVGGGLTHEIPLPNLRHYLEVRKKSCRNP